MFVQFPYSIQKVSRGLRPLLVVMDTLRANFCFLPKSKQMMSLVTSEVQTVNMWCSPVIVCDVSSDSRNVTNVLLQEYHNTLCDSLDAMGYSGKRITLEDLWREYDAKALYGLLGACCVFSVVVADSGIDLNTMLESGVAREADVYNGVSYKKAMQQMLPKFEEQGAFRFAVTPSTGDDNTV
jgi:hypothetical protein